MHINNPFICNLCHTYLQPLLGCKSLVSKTLSLLMDGVVFEDFQQHERGARDQDRYIIQRKRGFPSKPRFSDMPHDEQLIETCSLTVAT